MTALARSALGAVGVAVASFTLASAPSALAAGPVTERTLIEDTFPDGFLTGQCGVPVTTTVSGVRIDRTFENDNGRLVAVSTVNVSGTASADGGDYRFRDVGADVVRTTRDGHTTVAVIGQLPFAFSGRLVLDLDTGEIVAEPQVVRGEKQLEQACELLAG